VHIIFKSVDYISLDQALNRCEYTMMVTADLHNDREVSAYRMAPDGRIIDASPALARLLGYDSVENLVAHNQGGEEYDQAYVAETFREHGGQITGVETTWRRKDGSATRLRERVTAIYDERGQPLYYDGIIEATFAPIQDEQTQIPSGKEISEDTV